MELRSRNRTSNNNNSSNSNTNSNNGDYIIIQEGTIPVVNIWTDNLKCSYCNCVFKGRLKDIWFQLTLDGNRELICCPTCKRAVTVRENHGVD